MIHQTLCQMLCGLLKFFENMCILTFPCTLLINLDFKLLQQIGIFGVHDDKSTKTSKR